MKTLLQACKCCYIDPKDNPLQQICHRCHKQLNILYIQQHQITLPFVFSPVEQKQYCTFISSSTNLPFELASISADYAVGREECFRKWIFIQSLLPLTKLYKYLSTNKIYIIRNPSIYCGYFDLYIDLVLHLLLLNTSLNKL